MDPGAGWPFAVTPLWDDGDQFPPGLHPGNASWPTRPRSFPYPRWLGCARQARWQARVSGLPDTAACGTGGRRGIWIWRDGTRRGPWPGSPQAQAWLPLSDGRVSLPGPSVSSMRTTPLTFAHRSPRPGVTSLYGP